VRELRAKQGRHQEVETHEATGKDGRCEKGESAIESAEESAAIVVSQAMAQLITAAPRLPFLLRDWRAPFPLSSVESTQNPDGE
jgi:hypothetical protein